MHFARLPSRKMPIRPYLCEIGYIAQSTRSIAILHYSVEASAQDFD
jgi:hypothetical protein